MDSSSSMATQQLRLLYSFMHIVHFTGNLSLLLSLSIFYSCCKLCLFAIYRSAIEKYEFLCRLAEHTTQVVHNCTHDTPDLEILTQVPSLPQPHFLSLPCPLPSLLSPPPCPPLMILQISNSVQLALSLEIDGELKTQFIQTHGPIISSLLPSLPSPLSHLKALLLQYQEKSNKSN